MRKLQVLDLFSGIGGFSLGLESTGYYETVAFCEIEEYPRKVLRKHWPGVPVHDDIHSLRGEEYKGVDLVVGGFPCQPVSLAGSRKGKEDSRWLWPQFSRVIREAGPRWCLIENVPGLRTKHADEVLFDLEEQGYTCWPLVVGAVHAGALHRRQRVWIVANAIDGRNGRGQQQQESGTQAWEFLEHAAHAQRHDIWPQQRRAESRREGATEFGDDGERWDAADAAQQLPHGSRRTRRGRLELANGGEQWDWSRAPEPVLRGVDDGLPCGVDRRERLKALGNAVVPQVVAAIGRAIVMAEILR